MTYITIKLMSYVGLARNIKMPKLTHAAPIVGRKRRQVIQHQEGQVGQGGRTLDDEPELVANPA